MASLGVESLFTNIPVDETIKNSVDDLFSNNMYRGILSKSELYYLLKLAVSESSFIFDNILYKQILSLHYCFVVLQFALICKVFI